MNFYPIIKDYYEKGFYTKEQLDIFVKAGMLSEEQKQIIINGVVETN